MLEVGLCRDLTYIPAGKFTREEIAKPFTEYHARAAPAPLRSGWTRQIQKEERPAPAAETLDREFHPAAVLPFHIHDAAHQVAMFVPGLQGQTRSPQLQNEVLAVKGHQIAARVQQGRLQANLEEALNRLPDLGGISAGCESRTCAVGHLL